MNVLLYFKLYTVLKLLSLIYSHSFIFLFMYLSVQFQYYQSSNNLTQTLNSLPLTSNSLALSLPQKHKTFHLTWSTITSVLKSNYKKIIISIYSCNRFVLLVLDLSPSFKLNTAFFVLFNNFESLCSFRLVVALFSSTPRLALLVVNFSLSQSFLL